MIKKKYIEYNEIVDKLISLNFHNIQNKKNMVIALLDLN